MLKIHLETIQKDLNQHHRPKEMLLNYYIQLRLTKSLKSYYADLSNSAKYLADRNPVRMIGKLHD